MNNLYLVRRPKDDVVVCIMKNRADNKFHFVNLTKEHICPCGFDSVDEALNDLDDYKKIGKVIEYYKLP